MLKDCIRTELTSGGSALKSELAMRAAAPPGAAGTSPSAARGLGRLEAALGGVGAETIRGGGGGGS